jgi:hypothetical protein
MEGTMRVGESFGDACRNCGSTIIIIAPLSSAGACAVCSPVAEAWVARLEQGVRRRRELARLTALAVAARARAADRAQRAAERRAALSRWGAQLRHAAAGALREAHFRSGRASQA